MYTLSSKANNIKLLIQNPCPFEADCVENKMSDLLYQ